MHDEGGHGQLVALPPLPYRIMATDNRRHLPAVDVGEFALDNLTGIDRGGDLWFGGREGRGSFNDWRLLGWGRSEWDTVMDPASKNEEAVW